MREMSRITRLGYTAVFADILYHLTITPGKDEEFREALQGLRNLLSRVLAGLRLHRRQFAGRLAPLTRSVEHLNEICAAEMAYQNLAAILDESSGEWDLEDLILAIDWLLLPWDTPATKLAQDHHAQVKKQVSDLLRSFSERALARLESDAMPSCTA